MNDQPTDSAGAPQKPDDAPRHSNAAAAAFVLSLAVFVLGIARSFIPYNWRDLDYIVGLVYLAVLLLSVFCALGALLRLWMSRWTMKGLDPALTGIGIVLLCLWMFQMPDIEPTPPATVEDPLAACQANVDKIAAALSAYADLHGQLPSDARGPLYSLSLLYPKFVTDPLVFVAPTKAADETRRFPIGCSLAGKQCSYGYDNEFDPIRTKPDTPLAGDLPGNHPDGAHLITFGRQVTFTNTFVLGEDPADNIYTPDEGLQPEVDAYIRQ